MPTTHTGPVLNSEHVTSKGSKISFTEEHRAGTTHYYLNVEHAQTSRDSLNASLRYEIDPDPAVRSDLKTRAQQVASMLPDYLTGGFPMVQDFVAAVEAAKVSGPEVDIGNKTVQRNLNKAINDFNNASDIDNKFTDSPIETTSSLSDAVVGLASDWKKTLVEQEQHDGHFVSLTLVKKGNEFLAELKGKNSNGADEIITFRLGDQSIGQSKAFHNATELIKAIGLDNKEPSKTRAADFSTESSILKFGISQHLASSSVALFPEGVTVKEVKGAVFTNSQLQGGIFENTTFERCKFMGSNVSVTGATSFINCSAADARFLSVGENTEIQIDGGQYRADAMFYGEASSVLLMGDDLKFQGDFLELHLPKGGLSTFYTSVKQIKAHLSGMKFRKDHLDTNNRGFRKASQDMTAEDYDAHRKKVNVNPETLTAGYSNSTYTETEPTTNVSNNTEKHTIKFADGLREVECLKIVHPDPANKDVVLYIVPSQKKDTAVSIVLFDKNKDEMVNAKKFDDLDLLYSHDAELQVMKFLREKDPLNPAGPTQPPTYGNGRHSGGAATI